MIDIRRLKPEQQSIKHPAGFNSNLECVTRSLFSGLASFSLGFAGIYFLQNILQNRLPYPPPKISILISTIFASTISYKITNHRYGACRANWVTYEEKHIALTDE